MMLKKEKIDAIMKENARRLRRQKNIYDPFTGKGSPVRRFRLYINKKQYYLLPYTMRQEKLVSDILKFKSIAKYCFQFREHSMTDIISDVLECRIRYDFEFWCAFCVKIQDKSTKKLIPFTMRRAQLKLFKVLHQSLVKNEPIRVIVLKARQWGGSTLVQIFMSWIQLFHRTGWHSVIVADVEDQARNIKAMYSRLAQHHPKEVMPIVFNSFEGSAKNKIIENRNCIIYLGSMQKPDSLRSADVMMAHLSEVGLWKATEGKKPEDLVQSIGGTVPLEPYTMVVMESTAKGVGNYFHREWCKASSGESGYIPVFVAWFEIDMYAMPFKNSAERRLFARALTEEEEGQFAEGATLEAIQWYRRKKHTDSYDTWRMACEFPTTAIEAFQTTGRRAHPAPLVQCMRSFTCAPLFVGDLVASTPYGLESLDDTLHLEANPRGNLFLWNQPDKRLNIRRRYIVSMDIGGRSSSADWSVISIIDRFWLIDGGGEECIGTCRFHLDQDLAVWKAVQLAKFFNNALLVIEANSLNPKGTEGDHTLTILDEIKGKYDNIYCRTDPQRIIEGYPERYGFFTSRASKSDLVNQMNKRLREQNYIERDARALDEIDLYEIKEDGSYGAIDGAHDDIYMSRAIGLKASQTTELPILI